MVGARYYDEANGRFISVDPVLDLADPQQWNAYAYANNNPTTLSDPSGLTPRIDDDYDGGRGPLARRPPATSSPAPAAQRPSYPEPSPSPGPPPHPCPCSGDVQLPTAAEVGHVVVDIAGLAFDPIDAVNVIWYAVEGDWVNSGLSGASIIPVGGWFATAFKWWRNGKKAADAAAAAVNSLDEVGSVLSRGDLNPSQLSNLTRYTKKLPAGAQETVITRGADGAVQFSTTVPGRVPGSYATYDKVVDASGATIGYTKTTVLPDGTILHTKDKLSP